MNKLEDRSNQDIKVVIALGRGVASKLAAYLLKIQKYNIYGVTINASSPFLKEPLLNDNEVKEIKDFCQRLGIPHLLIDTSSELEDVVLKGHLISKLNLEPHLISELRDLSFKLSFLEGERVRVKADHICTGHFAKIVPTEHGNCVQSVHDEKVDQSLLIHALEDKYIENLILPLSNFGKDELLKLAKNFSLEFISHHKTYLDKDLLDALIKKYENFKIPGHFVNDRGEIIGEHQGVSNYELGQVIELQNTKYLVYQRVTGTQNIEILPLSKNDRKEFKLVKVKWSHSSPELMPFSGHVGGEVFHKVNVYPKTLNAVWVEADETGRFVPGSMVAIYMKKGGSSKIILSGIVEYAEVGEKENVEFLTHVF